MWKTFNRSDIFMKKFEIFCDQLAASMGAAASSVNSSFESPFNKSTSTVSSCEACSEQFTILKRKKLCSTCRKHHCTACLIKDINGSRLCNKCRILTKRRFSWNELMQLKIKDLRQYLATKNIKTDGCKEKKDLVELILRHTGGTSHNRQQAEHQEWVQELARQHQATQSEDIVTPDDSVGASESDPPPSNPPQEMQENSTQDDRTAEFGQQHITQSTQHQVPPNHQVPNQRMTLEQIGSLGAIDDLSVRQLKEVLANNFVDYKGCCEKSELKERTRRLWTEHHRQRQRMNSRRRSADAGSNQTGVSSGSSQGSRYPSSDPNVPPPSYGTATSDPSKSSPNVCDENEDDFMESICKICMDAPIDCVLLECGHFVACTKCGKQLSECPICRQYVVRAVHVFRA